MGESLARYRPPRSAPSRHAASIPVANPELLLDVDPLLGPLTDNGGQTLTHAITSASPAYNSGGTSLG